MLADPISGAIIERAVAKKAKGMDFAKRMLAILFVTDPEYAALVKRAREADQSGSEVTGKEGTEQGDRRRSRS
jgi:hypothetical protein